MYDASKKEILQAECSFPSPRSLSFSLTFPSCCLHLFPKYFYPLQVIELKVLHNVYHGTYSVLACYQYKCKLTILVDLRRDRNRQGHSWTRLDARLLLNDLNYHVHVSYIVLSSTCEADQRLCEALYQGEGLPELYHHRILWREMLWWRRHGICRREISRDSIQWRIEAELIMMIYHRILSQVS